MDNSLPSSCVLMLCGLPASGKSQYASMVMDNANRISEALQLEFPFLTCSPSIRLHLLDFDDYLRSSILSNHLEFTSEIWHESRRLAHLELEEKLKSISTHSKTSNHHTLDIIIIDDNMNYRAMRRKIFQLASKYGAGFVQMAINTPRDICFIRNESRDESSKVERNVIERMVFELPELSTHWWDVHAIVIDNEKEGNKLELEDRMPWKKLVNLMLAPLPSSPHLDLITHPSDIQAPNFLHELDKTIRKEIGRVLELEEMKIHGKAISHLKSSFMSSIRQFLKEKIPLSPEPMEMSSLIEWVTLTFVTKMNANFVSNPQSSDDHISLKSMERN